MEYTRAAQEELNAQIVIHELNDDEKEAVDVIAGQFAQILYHERITPADVRYAASVVAIRRAA